MLYIMYNMRLGADSGPSGPHCGVSLSDGSVQGRHLLRGFSGLWCFRHLLEKPHVQVALAPLPTLLTRLHSQGGHQT